MDAPARQAGTPPFGTSASVTPRRAARSAAIASDVAGADAALPDVAPPDATRPGARASGPDAPKGPGALRRSRPVRQTRSHAAPSPAARPPAAASGPDAPPGERGERIAKWLARAGVASRRDAEKLLAEGRVRVNNAVITHPATFVTAGDLVQVNGALVEAPGRARLWRYHKPDGLVTTHRDPEGRDTVFAALPPGMGRVVSVGRLDLNSEGLLLLTNDGGLARRLEMPANGWLRRYRVRVYGVVDEAALAGLASGIEIDGVRYGPIEAGLDSRKGNNGWVTVALREGRNREVRRVMEHLGLRVTRLIRVAYGPFQLGLLTRGSVEEVTAKVLREQIPDL
jgi:23S rRNA pseudouridine2605 synthase